MANNTDLTRGSKVLPVRQKEKETPSDQPSLPKIVSLFSGPGGLDWGFKEEKFPLVFAIDISAAAIQTHLHNFHGVKALVGDLEDYGPQGVLNELQEVLAAGERIAVIGGPPCQGFSRANSNARADDPRNRLPKLYLEIIAALQQQYNVEFVLFENVKGIQDRKHHDTFEAILAEFSSLGFESDVRTYSALDFGVPQTRSRVIISGFRDKGVRANFKPLKLEHSAPDLSVRKAIGHLPEPAYFKRDLKKSDIPYHENHWIMRPVSKKFSQPGGVQSAGRSFRRLEWDKPSLTVAYGNREIHVHPDGHRRLSIYEAMILQGFTEDFVLKGTLSEQVEQVSNAVPPPLSLAIAKAIRRAFLGDNCAQSLSTTTAPLTVTL